MPVFAYCHAMSMSNVGTKKEVGAEAMRSRNLIRSVNDMKRSLAVIHLRVISCNTVVKHNSIFFTVKKPRFAPTELVHLFRERILSENLLNTAVSLTREMLGMIELTALTRSSENGRPSLYALKTLLNLTRVNLRASL